VVTANGVWFFIEIHIILNTPVDQADGTLEVWVKNCGTEGVCEGSPTLVIQRTDVAYDRNATAEKIRSVWFQSQSNQSSQGERHIDQIIVSKTGPIGFMETPSERGRTVGIFFGQ
jgi:hypothetical protein